MLHKRETNALSKGRKRLVEREWQTSPKGKIARPKEGSQPAEEKKTYYLKGSNHFNKRNNHFKKRGIVPSSKKNNRSVIEKQLPHHRKRAASPPKNSCFTTEK
ncbi:hypothetical protein NXX78_22550 [Bacteroides fragilis]|nr:hypothetical protein [Bacteroides fragilis]